MRFASLYSGCGGLDLGLASAGFELDLACEISEPAAATLRALPGADLGPWNEARDRLAAGEVTCGDVHDLLNSGRLRGYRRRGLDLLAGGPPCQPFSVAGNMDPDDERAQLVYRFLDAVAQARPAAFIMENVPALMLPRCRPVLGRLCNQAQHLGYRTFQLIASASHHGVPQARKRLFFTGIRSEAPVPAPQLPPRHPGATALAALRELHAAPMGPDHEAGARITLAKVPVLRSSPYAGMLLNGGGRVMDLRRPAPTLPATMGGNRTPVIDLSQLEEQQEDEKKKKAVPWIEGYHAALMAGQPPLPSLPPGARLRRLTVREAAALSGFPPFYPLHGAATEQFRQVGNAVPPPLGRAVGLAVARALGAATLEPW